ncbi:MAG: hypothetical protein M3R53_06635 [Candidatus Eremiobacteraeota bacterium]|nr:hypothetical protein [Candidatus Eremiobacteraeota bacterium]
MRTLGLIASALTLLLQSVAGVQAATVADEQESMALAGGAWQAGKNVPCVDGFVTAVHSRLEEPASAHQTFDSGVVVEIRLPSSPKFLNGRSFRNAAVVHYDGDRTNKLMQSEKIGDKVQVCLVAFPTPTHDPQTGKVVCNPNIDPRGLVYRVYDYRHHAAYMGPDSQHSCGGA